ncbi:hypothetical protein POM88_003982 [Heracleum sosnowskyi]|uniref:Reverse transcriptase domain-containing protein n=1 Tax=Heracleum sosnowskyi TaxID=360622 RepID=A0AAD8JH68_9APIA|nr:hypothetical protein POM88_003982 [Heracleum sosnowskyi]
MLDCSNLQGLFSGISLAGNTNEITHLQFTDDTIIFITDDLDSVHTINTILIGFELLSGLKINFSKSKLYSMGKGCDLLDEGAEILGCSKGEWLMSYLGVTIGIGSSARMKLYSDPLFSKIQRKLAGWKCDSLNMAGQLDSMRRGFLWGEFNSNGYRNKKLHLINWNQVTQSKDKGGLGINFPTQMNKALLSKRWYKWHFKRSKSWNKLIRAKYSYSLSGGLELFPEGKKPSKMFSNILTMNHSGGFDGSLNSENFIWSIKNGSSALFWEDVWEMNELVSGKLSHSFSRLYRISKLKFTTVRDFCHVWMDQATSSSDLWNRSLCSGDLDEMCNLNIIVSSVVFTNGDDALLWIKSGNPYRCKDGRLLLSRYDQGHTSIIWKSLWKLKVPPKVSIFLWKTESSILPTRNQLVFEGIKIKDEEFVYLIKLRTLKWATISCTFPMEFDYGGFVDGSFQVTQDGSFQSGIRGFTKNRQGIGVVIRDIRGFITRLCAESLRLQQRRNNELAYLDEYDYVELETDNFGTYMECRNSSTHGALSEHRYVIQQINQRKADKNLFLKVMPVDEDANAMAIYLARHGAAHFVQMEVITQVFGRVFEIWCSDM